MECLLWCLPCIPQQPRLTINSARFTILKLLGEGGYSYVYQVQAGNGAIYALKKMRCPVGGDTVRLAMQEVHNYKEFRSPYVVRLVDSSVVQEEDGSKTVYVLLPFFESSLQDVINANVVNGQRMSEEEALRIFIGLCRGVQTMHRHAAATAAVPDVDSDGGNESDALLSELNMDNATELQNTVAYAHWDIKPANVMLSRDGLPVLCDLGSCCVARTVPQSRAACLRVQELAAEHCTLPYRAPELLDVRTGAAIDERVDVWSLGCTLYAALYGSSPFEREEALSGGSVSLAILAGQYSFPEGLYSQRMEDLVRMCLVVSAAERPTVEDVLARALSLQR